MTIRILYMDHTENYVGQTDLGSGDAMASPTGWIPIPYDYAPQHLRDAADQAEVPHD